MRTVELGNSSRRRGSRIRLALVKTAPEGTVARLEIRVERGHAAGPQVRLLINGKDLPGEDHSTGNHPRDLFETGALLPTDPPRRVALYGCSCGTFGCSALTALISRTGDQITWSDSHDFHGGEYDGPFHEDSTWPDPVHDPDADVDLLPTQLDLAGVTFDAEHYLGVVHDATQEWSQSYGRRSDWA